MEQNMPKKTLCKIWERQAKHQNLENKAKKRKINVEKNYICEKTHVGTDLYYLVIFL